MLYIKLYIEAYNSIKKENESQFQYQWLKNLIIEIGFEMNLIGINSSRKKVLIYFRPKDWSENDKIVENYLHKLLEENIELDNLENEEEKELKQTKVIVSVINLKNYNKKKEKIAF